MGRQARPFLEPLNNLNPLNFTGMKYFTISEMLYSPTAVKRGIWNGCDRTQEDNLVALVDNVLDPAREKYGKAVHVSSGYRCQQLNTLIHGALESQHLRGEAADLTTDAGPQGNLELARLIIASELRFPSSLLRKRLVRPRASRIASFILPTPHLMPADPE